MNRSPSQAPDAGPFEVQLRDVSRQYVSDGGAVVEALDRFTLTIRKGEIVSLIGPSGCGKSTLLRLIAGLDPASGGDLRIGDQVITGPGADRGLMFQNPCLFPWKSVRRNIESGLVARGVLAQQRGEVDQFLKLVGLEAFADAYPHQLSGGMAQRVALARALINHPRVLLLDEPLGALDQFTRMRMQDEVLRIWKARQTTMVLVTHDIDEALYLSDRLVLMTGRPGRVDRIVDVALPRPRHRTDPAFLGMRTEIFEQLHLVGAQE